MDQQLLQEQADRISKRCGAAVSIGTATVVSILLSVLPQIATCWSKEQNPDPAKVNAGIKEEHDKNPSKLQRKTAIAVRKKAPRGEKPSAADAQVMAREIIAEACEAAPETVSAFFARCSAPDVDE